MKLSSVEGRFDSDHDGSAGNGVVGAVSSAFADATDAGVEILAEGGNATDAACAVGFALTVCEPQGSGVGGQSIAIVHTGGRTVALDGSSRAPSLARLEDLADGDRTLGYRAATVPSTPAFYAWLHQSSGRLPWHRVLEPAIRLARGGYEITPLQHDLQKRELNRFLAAPSRSGARYFLKNGTEPYDVGDRFRQTELADLLEAIAFDGVEAFYRGEIAAQIDRDMRVNDGLLRSDDLALIPWPIERRPLVRRYRSVSLSTMPPPGAGRILLLVMMMLGALRSVEVRRASPEYYHYLAEVFRKAFLRRLDRPFDANYYEQIRDKKLLSRDYAVGLAQTINNGIDSSLPLVDLPRADHDETTHFSVMDAEGGTVGVTQSVELVYGSKVAADGLGFLYNCYLNAYDTSDPGHPYYLRPNAVPWSSAAPTIAFHDGEPWIACGSPGSERIFSSLAQFLTHVVDSSQSIAEAIDEPRLHCSTGGRVSVEAGLPQAAIDQFGQLGYDVRLLDRHSFYLGCVQATLRCQSRPGFQAAADPRRDGTAEGPA